MKKLILLVGVVLILGGAGWGYHLHQVKHKEEVAQAKAAASATVDVAVAAARRDDVPIMLQSGGTAVYFRSVAVRPRVDAMITGVHFVSGRTVKAGTLLLTQDTSQLETQLRQSEAALARDRGQLESAREQEVRYRELLKDEYVARERYEDIRAKLIQAQEVVKADQAQIDAVKIQLGHTRIVAPISGELGLSQVSVGMFARGGDAQPLVTINQIQPIRVQFSVPQSDVALLQKARAAGKVAVKARFPGDGAADGVLDLVDNSIDPASGSLLVQAQFENADSRILPGMLVDVDVHLGVEKGVLTVPAEAVRKGPNGDYLFVVEGGVAKMRSVTVSRNNSGRALIAKGLGDGDQVAVEGLARLADGVKVTVRN